MHARELIELAAVVTVHGPVLIEEGGPISNSSIEQYWTASKCRLDRWGRALKRLSTEAESAGPQPGRAKSSPEHGVLEEILTGEILTRIWTAVTCAYDGHRGTDLVEPIARSVMIGHLEARHRVLRLLVRGPGIDAEQAIKLNRLRRRTERWTDMLVGYLAAMHDVSQFAVDPDRARDFADDVRHQRRHQGGRYVWPLVQASLRAAFRRGLAPVSPNADLNRAIASSILSCFQPELFDSIGVFRSLWLVRLTNVANDAQGMIEDLLELDTASSSTGSADCILRRLSDRMGRLGK